MAPILAILPPQIIGIILDTVARVDDEDRRKNPESVGKFVTLRACALTCQAFLPLCRRHYYRHVIIKSHSGHLEPPPHVRSSGLLTTASSFVMTVAQTPGIGNSIEEMTLNFMVNVGNEDEYDYSSKIPFVVQQLTRLKNVTLLGPPRDGLLDWPSMSPPLRSLVYNILRLPTITYLSLNTIKNFTMSTLVPCIALKTLKLNVVSFASSITDDELKSPKLLAPEKNIELTILEIQRCSGNLPRKLLRRKRSDGKRIFSFEKLEILVMLLLKAEHAEEAQDFFDELPHVVEIHLSLIKIPDASDLIASISYSPCLETLKTLNLYLSTNNESQTDPLCGICAPLQIMADFTENKIEGLRFSVFCLDRLGYDDGDEWSALEEALLAPGWSSLKHVNLMLKLLRARSGSRSEVNGTLRDLPNKQLRRLGATESFTFNIDFMD